MKLPILLLAILVSSQLPPKEGAVASVKEAKADFSKLTTYNWERVLEAFDRKAHAAIVAAIDAQMKGLGFQQTPSGKGDRWRWCSCVTAVGRRTIGRRTSTPHSIVSTPRGNAMTWATAKKEIEGEVSMTWAAAKRESERRALGRCRRNAGLSLWLAVREVLQASPTLSRAYQEAMANGEQQEFLNSRPHDLVVTTEFERAARTLLVTSDVPMTLRDAMLIAVRNDSAAQRRRRRRRRAS